MTDGKGEVKWGGWFWASLSSIPVKFYQAKRLVESLLVSFGSVTSVSSVDHSTSFKRNASVHLLKFLGSGGSLWLQQTNCQSLFANLPFVAMNISNQFGWLDFFFHLPTFGWITHFGKYVIIEIAKWHAIFVKICLIKELCRIFLWCLKTGWSWRYHQVGTNGWNTRNFIDKLPFTKNHDLPERNDLVIFGRRFSIQHLPFLWSHQLWASLVLNTRPSMPERYRSLPIHVPSRRYWGDHHSWYPTRGRWLGLVPCVEIPKEPRLLQKYSPSLGVPKS